jgi:hypothetical protein
VRPSLKVLVATLPRPKTSDFRPELPSRATGRRSNLQDRVSTLQTPRATDGEKGTDPTRKSLPGGGQGLVEAVRILPTPVARDWKDGRASSDTHARNARPLNERVEVLPTPMVSDSACGSAPARKVHGPGHRQIIGVIHQLPTPTVEDSSSSGAAGYSTESGRHSGTTLTDAVCGAGSAGRRGKLNPRLSEWTMDIPVGWTSFEPLETASWSRWLRMHSGFFPGAFDG